MPIYLLHLLEGFLKSYKYNEFIHNPLQASMLEDSHLRTLSVDAQSGQGLKVLQT